MGGATVGLQRAGFRVIGVDIDPQPGYPGDDFIQADGLTVLADLSIVGAVPDLIWESWPCQEGNTITIGTHKGREHGHRQFIPQGRELSDALGVPYLIEQPTSSRKGLIRRDLTLCMDTFKDQIGPPPWVFRHRSFELHGFTVPQPQHIKHTGRVRGWRHGEPYAGDYIAAYGDGGGKGKTHEIQHALGIDWMTGRFDLCEAIPPAYAEYIGRAFLAGRLA